MKPEEIENIGLVRDSKNPFIFTDFDDIVFNIKTKELYSLDCVTGEETLYRKVTDIDDLKMAIYDGFPMIRQYFNLD